MANPFDQFDEQSSTQAANPFDQFDKSAKAPSLLGNETDGGYLSSAAKSVGTAAVKGLSNSVGTVGNLGNFADYLLARGHSAITGKPVEDVLSGYEATRKAQAEGSTLGKVRESIDPSKVMPSGEDVSAPILKRTGEYVPESELGKMGQAGLEAAFGMVGPGGGAATAPAKVALKAAGTLAPVNFAAGAVGQGVTDATGDPLLGMAAGMVAPGAAGAAGSKIARTARKVTQPFAEDLPVIGGRYAGQRDQMVGDRLRAEAQDPAALEHSLFPGPRQPGGDEIIPVSQPTTGQLTGDMGILGAERRAITEDNTPFNIRATEQDAARRAELARAAPDADAMKPSRFFQEQLDHIERGTNEAVERIQTGAQDLAGRLGPGESPENLGASIRNPIKEIYEEAKKARRALYDAVDPDGSISLVATPAREKVQEFVKGMDPYDSPMKPDESRLFGRVASVPDVMPFKSMIALERDIGAAMGDERRAFGETPTWGRLTQLKNAVSSAIHKAVDNQSAYEQAAVAAGKMRPEDTIRGRLEGVHGEYGGALGNAPRNAGAADLDHAGAASSGLFDVRGAEGQGAAGSGNAARAARVPEQVSGIAPQNLNDYPIYYPGGNLRARYEVVDHPNLVISHDQNFNPNPKFPQELQPRARESAPARDQVNGMASRLQPERLGPSPEANSGAPIIGPDNVVESGNGRALAIGKAYAKGNTAYRDWLEGQGFNTQGMKHPVLVARRTSEMTPAEREYFANSANSSAGLKMSAAEQASSDAKLVNESALKLVADAPIRSPENRDFVRAFADKLPATERGGILDKDGNLSQTGVRRIEAALAAKAFDDTAFVGRAFDSADSNIRNLAGALVDSAGPWARMRSAAHSGAIDGSHDITHELMDVVHKVMRARDEGVPIADILKQTDMFGSDVKPLVESLLFRDPEKGLLASRQRIASGLKTYAAESEKNLAGPRLFGDDVKPRDVFKTAISKAAPDAEEAVAAAPTFETGANEPVKTLQPNFDRAAADRLNAAKSSHKDLAETFRNPVIKPVLKTMGGADNYQLPTGAVPGRAVVKGDRGYQTAKDFLKAAKNDAEVVSAMQDRALSPLRTSLKPDGTINTTKFDNWKRDYAGVLKALDEVEPGFSKRFDSAARASDLLVEAGVKRAEILADAQKNAAAKFMKASTVSEVEDALGTILQAKTGPSQMKDLITRAKGNQEVIDGLRKASVDWMTRKFSATTESGASGDKKLQKGMFDKFVRNNATTLGELFPADQVNLFRAIAKDMDRSSRVLATNVAGSPGTAKDVKPMLDRLTKAAGDHKTVTSAVGGALLATLYHTGSLTAALTAAGVAAPAFFIKTMRAAGLNKVEDMFRDALLNPERARYYLSKIPPGAKPDTGPLFALSRSIRRGLVTAPALQDKKDNPAIGKYPAKKAA